MLLQDFQFFMANYDITQKNNSHVKGSYKNLLRFEYFCIANFINFSVLEKIRDLHSKYISSL